MARTASIRINKAAAAKKKNRNYIREKEMARGKNK